MFHSSRPSLSHPGDTIVLNKPVGYVSGQEEHQHVPAVRLLTRENLHLADLGEEERRHFSSGDSGALCFDTWMPGAAETLSGYAAAGRLDIDSKGVMSEFLHMYNPRFAWHDIRSCLFNSHWHC